MKAGKMTSPRREDIFLAEAVRQGTRKDAGWPWPARLSFMVAAAMVCWAIPLAILYLIVF